MKRFVAVSVALFVVLSLLLCSCFPSAPTEEKAPMEAAAVQKDTPQGSSDTFVSDNVTVKYLSHSLEKEYEGNDALRVEFEYTNTSEDTVSFMFAVSVMAFQNGTELETAFITDEDEKYNNLLKDIRPDTTITVAEYFLLEDTSNVEVEVSELISFSSDKLVLNLSF